MPLYMDIHTVDSDDFSVEDVVTAHMQDLEIQERFGVIQIKYWVNVYAKTIFCLMEGPNKEACNEVHKQSHGNTACNIIEVADDEFNLYLGGGTSEKDLAHNNSGEIDTGFRTVLLINVLDFSGQYGHYNNEIVRLINKYNGSIIAQPEHEILVSFVYAANAILCAKSIGKLLKSIPDNLEFSVTLLNGKPVDEEGNYLFEETKKSLEQINSLSLRNSIYLDAETVNLAESENITSQIKLDDFQILNSKDLYFFNQIEETISKRISDPNFQSNDLHEVLGLSKSKTYRRIKSLMGIAPNQLITEFRLRKSLKYLRNNERTISEIAFGHGFNSPAYFAKVFRKRFNITPTNFSIL